MYALTRMVCVNGFNVINLSYQLNTEGNQRNWSSRESRALNDQQHSGTFDFLPCTVIVSQKRSLNQQEDCITGPNWVKDNHQAG